ncbi:unnamed protein product [Brachionus calyciflorus]|uniref:Uncharacterized protein n=1 Tax=Brachionus calyciflorus TaxID=104777 RepID=A0A814RSM7_9BILA|nr:unnamed protein product [Brachionus calyciflorus]
MVQRKLYSGHKKRPLVKPFVITASNGRIIDVYGNYAAVENDASIMKSVMEKDLDSRELLKKVLKDGQKQMSSSEANQARLVTKCRYVIEVINGIFKQQFKDLKETPKTMLSHITDDYRIA